MPELAHPDLNPAPRSCDVTWLTSRLSIGGCLPEGEEGLRALVDQGIGAVIDCRAEACDDAVTLRRLGIEFLHLPTLDRDGLDLNLIDQGVAWVWHQWCQGRKVHVHCQHGIGRSSLLACCLLISEGDAPLDALLRAKNAREIVSLSPSQISALRAWATGFRERCGAKWDVPHPQEIERIVWRHLHSQR